MNIYIKKTIHRSEKWAIVIENSGKHVIWDIAYTYQEAKQSRKRNLLRLSQNDLYLSSDMINHTDNSDWGPGGRHWVRYFGVPTIS